MRTKLENLFIAFENKHFSAVQCDTELGLANDDDVWYLEQKSKKFWKDCDEARKDFLDELTKVDNEKSRV